MIRKIMLRWKLRKLEKAIEISITNLILKQPHIPVNTKLDIRYLRKEIRKFVRGGFDDSGRLRSLDKKVRTS